MRLPHLRQTVVCCAMFLMFVTTSSAAELFVADRASQSVLAFDEETGAFLRTVAANNPETPEAPMFGEPSGITFGPDGYLYVSNAYSGFGVPGAAPSVTRVDPVTGATTSFINNVYGAGGVAYHAATDSLFVSEFGNFDGDEIFRYDGGGNLLQTISGTGAAATGRSGMTFDTAGNLYVNEFNVVGVGSVMKYAFSGPDADPSDDYDENFTTYASGASATSTFPAPLGGFNGISFDASGDLFVTSLIGQVLLKFDVESGSVVGGASFGSPLPYPSGVAIGADGNVLVSSLGNDNPSDPFFQSFLFPGDIVRFNSVFTGASPFLVGDMNRDDVVDGADLAVWQQKYGEPYDFTFPSILAINGDLDGDFDTDGRDFLLWQRGIGNESVQGTFQPTAMVRALLPGTVASVPEPQTALLALSLCGGAWYRRSRRG